MDSLKVECKYARVICGETSVTITGLYLMHKLFADQSKQDLGGSGVCQYVIVVLCFINDEKAILNNMC